VGWAAWWAAHDEAVITLVIGAAIGAFANWVFFRKAEKPKVLAYEILSKDRIISATDDERDNLKVIYGESEVKDPNLIIIRVGNVGKQDIIADDFKNGPIEIDLGTSSLLSSTPSNQQNPAISIKYESITGRSAIGVIPIHLKPTEWFDFKIVTDGDLVDPKITARFVGETRPIISAENAFKRKRWIGLSASIAVAFLMVALVLYGFFALFGQPGYLYSVVVLLAAIIIAGRSALRDLAGFRPSKMSWGQTTMDWAKREDEPLDKAAAQKVDAMAGS
jgi:hypothetical protein